MNRLATALGSAVVLSAVVGSTAIGSHAGRSAFPGRINRRIVFNDENNNLVLVNPDGSGIVRLADTSASDTTIGASWSPDGKLIAYSKPNGSTADIYVIAPDSSGQREITFTPGNDIDPTWSGDGSRIAFETDRNGNSDIYSVAADGSDPRQLTSSPLNELDPSWSARGDKLAFTVESADKSTR